MCYLWLHCICGMQAWDWPDLSFLRSIFGHRQSIQAVHLQRLTETCQDPYHQRHACNIRMKACILLALPAGFDTSSDSLLVSKHQLAHEDCIEAVSSCSKRRFKNTDKVASFVERAFHPAVTDLKDLNARSASAQVGKKLHTNMARRHTFRISLPQTLSNSLKAQYHTNHCLISHQCVFPFSP